MEYINLELPSNPHYLQILRLSVASLANNVGFDVEVIEDLKVVASEVFMMLIPKNDRINIKIEHCIEHINMEFYAENLVKENSLNDMNLELKKQILLSLADEIKIDDNLISVKLNKK